MNIKIYDAITYLLMVITLVGFFILNLMPALIGGLVVFLIIKMIDNELNKRVKSVKSHNLTLLIASGLVVSILTLIGVGIYSSFQLGTGNVGDVSGEALNVLTQLKSYFPEAWLKYIPQDIVEMKMKVVDFMKGHVSEMVAFTSNSVKVIVELFLGMIIGAIVAFSFLHTEKDGTDHTLNFDKYPFMQSLMKRISTFTSVFAKVGGAQVKISGINAVLTAIYLFIVLPLCGISVPYATTLVFCTFLFGLIPVIGGLLSNSLIILLSLMVSLNAAIASVVFLVLTNQLEYYINAKIVGSEIKTSIWELLIAMLIFQAIFGVAGAVLAPVIYGYLKEELRNNFIIPN